MNYEFRERLKHKPTDIQPNTKASSYETKYLLGILLVAMGAATIAISNIVNTTNKHNPLQNSNKLEQIADTRLGN